MELLSKNEVIKWFNSNQSSGKLKRYVKSGVFLWRDGIIGETILVIVAGKLETIKTIDEPSVVLKNIEIGGSAENYPIRHNAFLKRYDETDKTYLIDGVLWRVANAKGEINAFQYIGATIKFIAPWNEEMICEYGDYVASPVDGAPDDIYRIEHETFKKTYKLKL